jgi:DNA-binding MarR family transcriptional regulator
MSDVSRGEDAEQARIMLGLLESVERNGAQTQRGLSSELGIALGLVNAYLKRCMNKGLVKVRQVPAHRYAYYLTPQGFAEKSRLTVEYLSYSFSFFREAKADCQQLLQRAKASGVTRVVLIGKSDLAEIAALCAIEQQIVIVALVQPGLGGAQFIGVPVFGDLSAVTAEYDAALVTDMVHSRSVCDSVIAALGENRVLVPELLRVRTSSQSAAT